MARGAELRKHKGLCHQVLLPRLALHPGALQLKESFHQALPARTTPLARAYLLRPLTPTQCPRSPKIIPPPKATTPAHHNPKNTQYYTLTTKTATLLPPRLVVVKQSGAASPRPPAYASWVLPCRLGSGVETPKSLFPQRAAKSTKSSNSNLD